MAVRVKKNWEEIFYERLSQFEVPEDGRLTFAQACPTLSFYWVEWSFVNEDGFDTVTQLWRVHKCILETDSDRVDD